MSEQKNASHVGGKQEWENRNVRAEERQKFNDRSIEKDIERQEMVTHGESVTVRRNSNKRG